MENVQMLVSDCVKPYNKQNIIIPILQQGALRHRGIKWLPQCNYQSSTQNAGVTTSYCHIHKASLTKVSQRNKTRQCSSRGKPQSHFCWLEPSPPSLSHPDFLLQVFILAICQRIIYKSVITRFNIPKCFVNSLVYSGQYLHLAYYVWILSAYLCA